MGEEDFYGIRDNYPLSLKNRFWARLVEKLVLMSFQKDKENEEVYHFIDANGKYFASLRLIESLREGEDVDIKNYDLVELLNTEGKVLVKEKIYEHRYGGFSYHPLTELFELVRSNEKITSVINEIKNINKFLGE